MLNSLKKRLRNFLTGPFKWPTFFAFSLIRKENLILELIVTLYKSKRYIPADRMVNLKFKSSKRSLPTDLTPSEENLEMRRFFWEEYLARNYHTPGVIRLAGIYEQLGRTKAAHRLLYLSIETSTNDNSVLQYFFLFCLRHHYLDDASTLSMFLSDQDRRKLDIAMGTVPDKTSKGSSFTKDDIQDLSRLKDYCDTISKFFDVLREETIERANEYPHIVSITFQDITHDNRVKKIASSIGMRGYQSSLICRTHNESSERGFIGNAAVLKLPVSSDLQTRVRSSMRVRPLHGYISDSLKFSSQILRIRRSEITISRYKQNANRIKLNAFYLVLKVALLQILLSLSNATNSIRTHFTKLVNSHKQTPYRHWQNDHLDYQETFGPQIEKLKPDLIHVNDFHLVGVGVTAARNLRKKGVQTKVIYDAHELVEGIHHRYSSLWKSEISHFISDVDAVVCVSELQAKAMKTIYELEDLPTVVANAPCVTGATSLGSTIKEDLNIDGILLTYHGWANESRGVTTMVKALEFLPSKFHLVLMVMGVDSYLESLKDIEEEIRKRLNQKSKRLHFLPYVEPNRLAHYLSSSDATLIGLLPIGGIQQSNHHIAMPNKLYESIQAKVPVITSDMPALSAFVNDYRIGTVYEAGSSKGLAEAILDQMESKLDREKVFTDELLDLCSWEHQIQQLFNLYEETLDDLAHPKKPVTNISLNFIAFEDFVSSEESTRSKSI